MTALVTERFVPTRIHVKEQPPVFERFHATWTPTVLVVDPQDVERHRIEGFLPVADFLAQLRLGLAHSARGRGEWAAAERAYRALADDPAAGDLAAEATYWAGVARYKASGKAEALAQTASAVRERFPDSPWTKKASVWSN